MREMIEEKLKDIIISVCSKQVNRDEITDNTSLIYDLKMDSVSFVGLLVEVEEQFAIEIVDGYTAIDNMTNFQSLVGYIIRKKEG